MTASWEITSKSWARQSFQRGVKNISLGGYSVNIVSRGVPVDMAGEDECGLYNSRIIVKYPKYLPYDERKKSFVGFPLASIVDELVDSGFFHTGHKDETICFLCGLGLKSWSLGEKPWITHTTWNPECWYVISCKSDNICRKKAQFSKNGCRRCCIRRADALCIPC